MGRVMVVSGAFATHTTKLYNYYVCDKNVDFSKVNYLAVNYINELQYLGQIIKGPILCKLEGTNFTGLRGLPYEVKVDLKEFICKLDPGEFQLILLKPIIGGCEHLNLTYNGHGPFVNNIQRYRLFENLADFFAAHQSVEE